MVEVFRTDDCDFVVVGWLLDVDHRCDVGITYYENAAAISSIPVVHRAIPSVCVPHRRSESMTTTDSSHSHHLHFSLSIRSTQVTLHAAATSSKTQYERRKCSSS